MQAAVTSEVPMDTCEEVKKLFQTHHATVLQAAYQITGDVFEAEDVLQTIFVRLLKREDCPLGRISRGYLKRAAINAALDIVRSRKSARTVALECVGGSLAEKSAGPDRLQSASELRKWLREAVARLNPTASEMFSLRFFQDLTNNEIADLLGTSPGTVAVTLHRTRIRLQNEMESFFGERP